MNLRFTATQSFQKQWKFYRSPPLALAPRFMFSTHSADSVCVDVYLNVASLSGCADWDLFYSKQPTENLTHLMECFLKRQKQKKTWDLFCVCFWKELRENIWKGEGALKKKKRWKVNGQTFCHIQYRPIRFLHSHFSQLVTIRRLAKNDWDWSFSIWFVRYCNGVSRWVLSIVRVSR